MTENVVKSVLPGRRSPYVVDAVLEMGRKGFLGFFYDIWKTYGDLSAVEIGSRKMILAVHPEHVRYVSITNRQNYEKLESYDIVRRLLLGDGILTSRGDSWRRQRKLMAPFFAPRGLDPYYSVIVRDGCSLIERWEQLAGNNQPVEMSEEMMRVTATIILHTMFSSDSDEGLMEIKQAVETMIQFTARFESNPFHLPLSINIGPNKRYQEARQRVYSFIDRVIQHRRSLPQDQWPDDLLSKLMLARDEESGQPLSEEMLRDECVTIFFAGHETTARTLTFMWYALSQHPQVTEHLHAELDSTLGERFPTADDLKNLPYTMQVIKESLRLYPAAPFYIRDIVADDEIDGYRLPAGNKVLLSPYLTHRHPDFWPEPEQFDPERWRPECEAAQHPYAFHPFAAGQRICLGNHFSLFESHLLAAMLAAHFAPRLLPGHQPQLDMAGTLTSRNGMPMFIERRN